MPANAELLTIVQARPGWRLENSTLYHESGYRVQKRQAEPRWSAWPSVNIKSDGNIVISTKDMAKTMETLYPGVQPKLNYFTTAMSAVLWCETCMDAEEKG